MSTPKGYSSQEKEDRLSAQFSTVEPVREQQFGLSVVSHEFVYEYGTGTIDAGSTSSILVSTDISPLKGDVINFTSGPLLGLEAKVWEVDGTSIVLSETMSVAPDAGDTFQVLRHKYPLVNPDGTLPVAIIEQAVQNVGTAPTNAEVKMAGGFDGTVPRYLKTDSTGELQIDVVSSALPSGAATEAKQDTGNTSLGTIAGAVSAGKVQVDVVSSALPTGASTSAKQPALGTAGTASADVITVQGIASMTALKVDGSGVTQPVSGTVTANAGTGNFNVIQGTATNLKAQAESYQGGTAVGSANPLQVTLANTGANSTAVKVDGSAVTQPISAAALPLPSGAATSAAQTDGTQKTKIVDAAGGIVTTTTTGPVKALDVNVVIAATSPGNDVFATQMVGTRYNQVEVQFETAPGTTYLTQTFAGGGAVSHTNGHALYSTSTAVTAQAKAVSVGTIVYRPGNEIYAYFTVAYTAPTSAASYQRIGIYDTSNGFFVGYEGTSFGVTVRNGGSDLTVARASFNGDLLTGAAGSKFTRNGSPEAINLAFSNLFRIRFGWLGSGAILFDVFSPDGVWVNFHTIKQPNSSLNPSIQTPNLPITLDVNKTASDATNLIMATACWAAGAASAYTKITDTLTDNSLAGLTRSVITGVTTGGGGGYVNVKVNPSGALVADVTGTVAATQSGTWNIATITNPLPTGTNTIGKVDVNTLSVIDLLDAGILDTSILANNIPGSASAPTQVVASTAAATKKLQLLDTTGAFIGVYTGAAASEVLQFVMGPGSDQTIEHAIPAATRISLKRLDSTTAISSGIVAINFIG